MSERVMKDNQTCPTCDGSRRSEGGPCPYCRPYSAAQPAATGEGELDRLRGYLTDIAKNERGWDAEDLSAWAATALAPPAVWTQEQLDEVKVEAQKLYDEIVPLFEPSAPPSPPAEVGEPVCEDCGGRGMIYRQNEFGQQAGGHGCHCQSQKPEKSPSPPQRAPVITGPGEYLERGREGDEVVPRVAEIVGWSNRKQRWIGFDHQGDYTEWTADGGYEGDEFPCSFDITGPYAPPPEPVLTITDEHHERGWVYAWTKVNGTFPEVQGISVTSNPQDVGEMVRAGLHVYVHKNGPLVVCESDWPRVQQLVAQVNAAGGKAVTA